MNTSRDDVTSLRVQRELQTTWASLSPHTETYITSSIEEAVSLIRSWPSEKEVFVTGSLHLIGGLFVILDEPKNTFIEL
jgi:folylpolyglutamate synthase